MFQVSKPENSHIKTRNLEKKNLKTVYKQPKIEILQNTFYAETPGL